MPLSQDQTRSKMKHDGTLRLFDYWTALRAGRAAPYKSEVSAAGVGRRLASQTFILENLGRGNVRFRLAGSSLYDMFGVELRGMSARSMVLRDDRERLLSLIDAAIRRPCLGLATLSAEAKSGDAISIELLLAPLRSDFDEMNRLIGAAHILDADDTEPAPRRCRVVACQALDYEHREVAEPPIAGFAEDQATFDTHAPPNLTPIAGGTANGERRRGHLRLVDE